MKKVFFIIPSFRAGGAERAAILIANELHKKSDLNVTLVVFSAEGSLRNLVENVKVIDLKKPRARQAFFALRKALQDNNPDVVFSALPQANVLVYLINTFTKKTWKTVCMLQNYYEKIIEKTNPMISFLFTKALENADVVIPNSKEMAKNLIDSTNVSPEHVHPIYNPIDLERVQKLGKENVDSEIFNYRPILIGCGSLEEQKGFKYLIGALPEIKEGYPDAQIVLLGEGSLKSELQKQAKNLNISDSVHFFGFVDNPYKYMCAADVFILSSLWEGLPTVLIEAMATGISIVATNCPTGPQEILKRGKLGKLIPTHDSKAISGRIHNILRDGKVESEDFIERANDFRPEIIIKRYVNFVADLENN